MMSAAIRVEGLSKQYRIGERQERYDTFRESVTRSMKALVTRDRSGIFSRERMWALQDVSFEIEPGQAVGIIGRNGAGKSTLLRVLSRITEPTSGYAELRGRLGCLLEVGTGFHPELTGRDNIFLNGAILGMRRREIATKFDEIVEFSGVERFIDTPVKRYSSGMYVRLAFSVAAHLEPEILLVDEVLAVGDAEFQRRCLGKMEEIGRSGRTVLFVSHNMASITRLCERAIFLHGGSIVADGPAAEVVAQYLTSSHGYGAERLWIEGEGPGNEAVRLIKVRVLGRDGDTSDSFDVREAVGIEVTFDVGASPVEFVPWLALYNDQGQHIFSAMDTDRAWQTPRNPGRYVTTAWIPPNLLNEGSVFVSASLNTFSSGGKAVRQAFADEAVVFNVVDSGEGDTARGHYGGRWPGSVRPLLTWSCDYE